MKKHLLLLALAACILVSCSKSKDQLARSDAAPEKKMAMSRESTEDGTWSKIYPVIMEPRPTHLGTPDSYLSTGDLAVFYVVITGDPAAGAFTGDLILSDANTGELLETITMRPHTDPAVSGLILPEEIEQSREPFMFAVVDINSLYTGRLVTLSSSVQINSVLDPGVIFANDISYHSLAAAFTAQ